MRNKFCEGLQYQHNTNKQYYKAMYQIQKQQEIQKHRKHISNKIFKLKYNRRYHHRKVRVGLQTKGLGQSYL